MFTRHLMYVDFVFQISCVHKPPCVARSSCPWGRQDVERMTFSATLSCTHSSAMPYNRHSYRLSTPQRCWGTSFTSQRQFHNYSPCPLMSLGSDDTLQSRDGSDTLDHTHTCKLSNTKTFPDSRKLTHVPIHAVFGQLTVGRIEITVVYLTCI